MAISSSVPEAEPKEFLISDNRHGYDYRLNSYDGLKNRVDHDFAGSGFGDIGLWQIMSRVYRKIETGEDGYDGMNPKNNPYEVASTLATSVALNGVQDDDIKQFAAFAPADPEKPKDPREKEGQVSGHNPIMGTNQTLSGQQAHSFWLGRP